MMMLSILLPIAQLAPEVTDILQIIDDIEYITRKHKGGVDKLDKSLLKTINPESVKYNKGETLVCLIENENLIIKRREVIRKSDSEDHNISMMIDHKNVVKTFLIIQAKKGDMRIEYSISPYYEEEVKMNMFKSPKDLLDYLKQLATGISHLHCKNIKHGDIKIENTRLTYYNKTITTEQREFIVKSFDTLQEKTVKRPKGDSVNKTEADDECNPNKPGNEQPEENKNGLVWLNVYKNESLLNSVLLIEKIQKNNEPTYVLIDLDEGDFFDADKLHEDLTKHITKLKVDIHKYESLETLWGAKLWKRAKELGIVNGSERLQEAEQLKIWTKIIDLQETDRWIKINKSMISQYMNVLCTSHVYDDLEQSKTDYGCETFFITRDLNAQIESTRSNNSIEEEEKEIWTKFLELEITKACKKNVILKALSNNKEIRRYLATQKWELYDKIYLLDAREREYFYRYVTKLEASEMFKILNDCRMFRDEEKLGILEKKQVWLAINNMKKLFWLEMWEVLEDVTRSKLVVKSKFSKLLEKRKEVKILEEKISPSHRLNNAKKFTRTDTYDFATTFFECSKQFMLKNRDNIKLNNRSMLSSENLCKIFVGAENTVVKILSKCSEIDVNLRITMCDLLKAFPTEEEYIKYLQQLAFDKKNDSQKTVYA